MRAGGHKPLAFARALGLHDVGNRLQLAFAVLIKSEDSKHVIRRDL